MIDYIVITTSHFTCVKILNFSCVHIATHLALDDVTVVNRILIAVKFQSHSINRRIKPLVGSESRQFSLHFLSALANISNRILALKNLSVSLDRFPDEVYILSPFTFSSKVSGEMVS